MDGPLLLIKLNPTRALVETGMEIETMTVIEDVIVIGVGIATMVVDVVLVGTVSNVESLAILLENVHLEKGQEEAADMVEGMTDMEVAVVMALIVMVTGMVDEVETLVVVGVQEMTSIVVTGLVRMSVLLEVAIVHDRHGSDNATVWRASTRSMSVEGVYKINAFLFRIASAELLSARRGSLSYLHFFSLFFWGDSHLSLSTMFDLSTKFVELCCGLLHFGSLLS
ncbi:hypothetical protein CDL12_28955 [Handroanthus impetiginosus]|uniref:Uncharacterized protein n=1 Tax=Handroanthus impetiginosus TaxID=429701 RepID=A0A2G9FZR6_9LAMI|nr:hypothetical protein CDL12_28955 [Handroanthus impetiginosus]